MFQKVWFQNRRMKDKRQRLSLAWPVADPMFAAYLLQAAGYPYPLPLAPSGPCYQGNALGASRYSPYGMPIRPQPLMRQDQAASMAGLMPTFPQPLGRLPTYAAPMSSGHPLSPPGLPLSLKMPPTPPAVSSPSVSPLRQASHLSPVHSSPSPVHGQQLSPLALDTLRCPPAVFHTLEHPTSPIQRSSSSSSNGSPTAGTSQPRLFQPYKLDLPEKA